MDIARRDTLQERDEDHASRDKDRLNFLQDSSAVLTPPVWYAAWLSVFKSAGGEIRHSRSATYQEPGIVYSGNIVVRDSGIKARPIPEDPEYHNIGFNKWMPTVWPGRIPAGYGSGSLELVIMPDLLRLPKGKKLPQATNDWRPGWEWGHTSVFDLRLSGDSKKFVAWTNNPDHVRSYSDVDTLIADGSAQRFLDELMQYLTTGSRSLGSFAKSIEK